MQDTKTGYKVKRLKADQIVRIEQEQLTKHLDKIAKGTIEKTLNSLLDGEAVLFGSYGRGTQKE